MSTIPGNPAEHLRDRHITGNPVIYAGCPESCFLRNTENEVSECEAMNRMIMRDADERDYREWRRFNCPQPEYESDST